jgi:hypothetical protein
MDKTILGLGLIFVGILGYAYFTKKEEKKEEGKEKMVVIQPSAQPSYLTYTPSYVPIVTAQPETKTTTQAQIVTAQPYIPQDERYKVLGVTETPEGRIVTVRTIDYYKPQPTAPTTATYTPSSALFYGKGTLGVVPI